MHYVYEVVVFSTTDEDLFKRHYLCSSEVLAVAFSKKIRLNPDYCECLEIRKIPLDSYIDEVEVVFHRSSVND